MNARRDFLTQTVVTHFYPLPEPGAVLIHERTTKRKDRTRYYFEKTDGGRRLRSVVDFDRESHARCWVEDGCPVAWEDAPE